jgi:hypothetical protein
MVGGRWRATFREMLPTSSFIGLCVRGTITVVWGYRDWTNLVHDLVQGLSLVNTVMLGNSWVVERLTASQEGLSSMKWVLPPRSVSRRTRLREFKIFIMKCVLIENVENEVRLCSCIRKVLIWYTIYPQIFRDFPQSFRENFRVVRPLDYDRLFTNTFVFTFHVPQWNST